MLRLPPRPNEKRVEPVDDLEKKAEPLKPEVAALERGQLVKEDVFGVFTGKGVEVAGREEKHRPEHAVNGRGFRVFGEDDGRAPPQLQAFRRLDKKFIVPDRYGLFLTLLLVPP